MKKSFSLKNAHHSSSRLHRVGLQRVADLLLLAEGLLQLDHAAEEVDAEQGRLAAVPDELDDGRRLRLDVLLDVLREHFVRHPELLVSAGRAPASRGRSSSRRRCRTPSRWAWPARACRAGALLAVRSHRSPRLTREGRPARRTGTFMRRLHRVDAGRLPSPRRSASGSCPVKRDFASAPIASTTGVPRSMPTSAVSSAENMPRLRALDPPLADLLAVHEQRALAALAPGRRRRRRNRTRSWACRARASSRRRPRSAAGRGSCSRRPARRPSRTATSRRSARPAR